MDIFSRIKRLVIRDVYRITAKAAAEMRLDGLIEQDAVEAIVNVSFVRTKNSRSPF